MRIVLSNISALATVQKDYDRLVSRSLHVSSAVSVSNSGFWMALHSSNTQKGAKRCATTDEATSPADDSCVYLFFKCARDFPIHKMRTNEDGEVRFLHLQFIH